jgi:hypothetical protein
MTGHEVFVVAFDEADAASQFLGCAPGKKTVVNGAFIARQSNPQIEDIAEKDDILRALFKGPKHTKKYAVVAQSLIDMCVADNEHRQSWFRSQISATPLAAQSDRVRNTVKLLSKFQLINNK